MISEHPNEDYTPSSDGIRIGGHKSSKAQDRVTEMKSTHRTGVSKEKISSNNTRQSKLGSPKSGLNISKQSKSSPQTRSRQDQK